MTKHYNFSGRKTVFNLLLCVLSSFYAFGQNASEPASGVILASEFHVTRPIRDIFAEQPVDENKVYTKKESEDRKYRRAQQFEFSVKDGPKYGNDENSVQKEMGTLPPLPLKANWIGQTASGFRPFDPSGAVGPNHYVQMINSTTFKVYNKTSGAVLLTGTLGNLWSPATANAGDPIVMYDKAADRWFLAQFGSGNQIYIAVSQTSDPTGAYYTYTYVSPLFPDYLKFSVWSDGYYMTSNQSTQKVFSFNRAEILAGTPGARSIYVNFSPPKSGFFCPLPGDAADGTLPPVGTPCPIFSYSDNGWGAGYADAVNIYQMSVNWVPATPTATVTLAGNLATAAFDASYNASWNDCPQPGTTQKLDGIGGACMYRAQWKSWSGYNTILLNWGVKSSTTQRSIKWCELRQDQTTNTWSIFQEGIYRPDTTATRWMGSMAMDNNGSIGLSYIKSDPTSIYPGLYYTGRRSCDPLGTMPVIETMVVAGTGYQTGTNRVGDYAHTTLDMDGLTFWSTSEYMGGTSGGSAATTRIFSYQVAPCGNNASVYITQTGGSNPQCPGASATFTATPFNGGSAPIFQWKRNGTNVGTNSPTYSTTSLATGEVISCEMTSNLVGVTGSPASSNSITMTVSAVTTPGVTIAITSGTNPTCPGVDLAFTATTTNAGPAPTYQWKLNGLNVGSNSATFTGSTFVSGQVVTCQITSNALCNSTPTAISNGITVTTPVAPTVTIAQTSGTNPSCAGNALSFTATPVNAVSPVFQWKVNGVNTGTNGPTFTTSTLTNGQSVSCEVTSASTCPLLVTLGLGTGTNTTTSDLGAAYPTYYGNGRQQYLILASELTALGLTAGNISSLAFGINLTTGNPATLNGYTIKMGGTASTAMTAAFLSTTFTTVYGPLNYTPALNSWNTHTFSTPYNWDGLSNIVIDICFSNSVVGTVAYQSYQSSTPFVSTVYYQADGSGGAGACTTTSTTGTGSIRPNMKIGKAGTGLVASSNTLTMSVNTTQTPSISITQTAGSNPSCAGSSVTFTATATNGGTTPSYQWKINGVNAGTNSVTFTTNTLSNGQIVTCVLTSTASCASPLTATSNAITMNVNATVTPSVSISLTNGSNPSCSGTSVTFTATATNGGTTPSYQWKINGTNAGTNSATFTTNTLTNGQIITCVMTSAATCVSPTTATSNAITMNVNTTVTPAISISLTNGSNPSCSGSSVTFTATATNGGTTPSYQWKINGTNAGTNSAIFTTNTLTNGQIITCVLTSTAACVSLSTATSTGIIMGINSLPSVTCANVSGCAGIAIPLTGAPAGGIFSVSNPYLGPSNNYTYTFTDNNGCTSTSTPASITVNQPNLNPSQSTTTCDSYTWAVNGMTYTSSGTKNATYSNIYGCDSSYLLQLVLLQSTSSVSAMTATNSYTWPVNGMTYTTSGIYSFTSLNASGCDSVLTLNLTINVINPGVHIAPKVLLAGPYNSATGLMNDSLRINHLIPAVEPYSSAPLNFPQISNAGGETVSPAILSVTGDNAIVDWVFLELRSASNPALVVSTKRALLQRDGDVVSATDGVSAVEFPLQTPGNYYISIKHRNHLGVMTSNPVSLSPVSTTIDFTSSDPVWVNPAILNAPRKVEGNLRLLFVGDANANKAVKYNGYANDKDQILSTVGVTTANNIVSGYRLEDVNMDSRVKYNSTNNDRTVILNSVGASTPNVILFQHTPN